MALEVSAAARSASTPVSAYKLGQEIGKPQASLNRVLRKLADAGVLQEGTKAQGGKNVKVFSFNERWADAIEAFQRRQSVGLLKPGGRVILLRGTSVEAAAKLLKDKRYCPHVAWVAEFDDSVFGAAIGLREGVERSVITAFLPELRRLGAGVDGAFSLSVGRTFDQPEATQWTRDVLEGPVATAPPLPSGPC